MRNSAAIVLGGGLDAVEKIGMDSRFIIYENQSIDTIGNAWFVKKICIDPYGITKCRIITSDYVKTYLVGSI